MSSRTLHVIPMLSLGGGSRSAIVTAAACAKATGADQAIASLRPAAPGMAESAEAAGVTVLDAPSRNDLLDAIDAADIVQIHLWNSPELIELLEQDLPPCRLLVWPHVAGNTPPQVLHASIFERAALTVATSPQTASWVELSTGERPAVIWAVGGWDRVDGVERSTRDGFNVGYIGTVGSARIHDDFVALSAAVRVPDARFIICGTGDRVNPMLRETTLLGVEDRFEFQGQIDDIGAAISDFDVFGYPLRTGSSASADLSLKEAMYAGVPPVVLPDSRADEIVEDGITGIVAADEASYPRAIEALHADPAERRRLGENAHAHAAEHWSPDSLLPLWRDAHEQILAAPLRDGPVLATPDPSLPPGPARFVRNLGEHGTDFDLSLRGTPEEAAAAEARIPGCAPAIGYEDGGLFDHMRRHRDDPTLAFWTGLFLSGQGHPALAAAEFVRARKLGFDSDRLARHRQELAA